jgi:hypothetical protein
LRPDAAAPSAVAPALVGGVLPRSSVAFARVRPERDFYREVQK